ncbi:NrfD/PsrC family molybdoenzyme membrane anchor subunit [Cryptosporangium sp. NPDC051539]|uniref:NrfD/PsrC family molybdoenzyme membrane anchor subunit n=1 Tax=Cryptosporangium sp. NPDC051539 TaxID=3363962 RepID=UPI0037985AE0
MSAQEGRRRGGGRRGGDGGREQSMVPRAEFRSYYGRPVLKAPVWKEDIAYYFFLGGLAAGSALLAAGADLTDRPALRRGGRLGGLAALSAGTYYLIVDLGRPERFHHMLRVVKPTSPMSMGTWALSAFGGALGAAAVSELVPSRWPRLQRFAQLVARPSGLAAAAIAPAVASYTAVLISHTAVPFWNTAKDELPFLFVGSAAASGAGLGMIVAPPDQAGPARRLAVLGAGLELAASHRMEGRLGLVEGAIQEEKPRRYFTAAKALTIGGAVGAALLARRSRTAAVVSGAALLAGSLCQRLGVFHAGVASTEDPKYVVGPQREALAQRSRSETPGSAATSRPITG